MNKHTSEMNNSNNFKQPEALRLADALEADQQGIDLGAEGMGWGPSTATRTQAAAELRRLYAEVDRLSYQLAYPDNFVKEPVAIADGTFNHNCPVGRLLYTSPPASSPLTAEEAGAMYNTFLRNGGAIIKFVRAIEAAHGIKGGA